MIKDRAGMALMFLMPMVLVLVMTILQDNTFKAVSDAKIKLLLLNNDQSTLGNTIESELLNRKLFTVEKTIDGTPLTIQHLKQSVADGEYKVGIVIPKNATKTIKKSIGRSTAKTLIKGYVPKSSKSKNIEILIYIDPAIQESYKISMMSSLRELAAEIKKDFVITEVLKVMNQMFTLPGMTLEISDDIITYREEYAVSEESEIIPNSVQHNVPAWTLFAMFFVVISLSSNMIIERNQGSYTRLLTMPISFFMIISSKALIYFLVCIAQFTLMLLMGIYVLPLIDMPALGIGQNIPALILIVAASALAAVGYSIFVGVVATTVNQVSSFGAISVVIMSAIGGIWVPVFAMPGFMRTISIISPLNWGIDGFYEIFVRGGNLGAVFPNAMMLIIFALTCITFAIFYNRFKRNRE